MFYSFNSTFYCISILYFVLYSIIYSTLYSIPCYILCSILYFILYCQEKRDQIQRTVTSLKANRSVMARCHYAFTPVLIVEEV